MTELCDRLSTCPHVQTLKDAHANNELETQRLIVAKDAEIARPRLGLAPLKLALTAKIAEYEAKLYRAECGCQSERLVGSLLVDLTALLAQHQPKGRTWQR